MLDNILLEALAAVIDEGGFDKASAKLNISQSAVSQRIRNLEEQTGRALVVRSVPPEPTEDGRKLIRYFRQVRLMEHELNESLGLNPAGRFMILPVGVNADSLATWFLDALEGFLRENRLLLDLYVDDENRTHEMLRRGEVVGCIGTARKALKSCRSDFLTTFDYLCVCSPDYKEEWFPDGLTLESVQHAPAAVFNRKDETQGMMLEKMFPGRTVSHPIFYVPSSESFVDVVRRGMVYGMVPEFQVEDLLQSGELIELEPNGRVPVSLYWHSWGVDTPLLEGLRRTLISYFKK